MQTESVAPPVAKVSPVKETLHGEERVDEFAWMKSREDPEVISYLEAENDYTKSVMQDTEELQESLYREMLARIKETDLSVPVRIDDFFYYLRTEEGKQYPIYCRKFQSLDAVEEIILDQNDLAEGNEYFAFGTLAVSPDHRILAYSSDTLGREIYTLHFKDLTSGALLPDQIENIEYSVAWANDNRSVFYSVPDEAKRPYRLMRHILGTNPASDALIYEETDAAYYLGAVRSKTKAFIFMSLGSLTTSEVWYLDANRPEDEFKVIHPREQGVRYEVAHQGDVFVITTDDDAKNFKVVEAPIDAPGKENWRTVVPHNRDIKIDHVEVFADHRVFFERRGGFTTARIQNIRTGEDHPIDFPEPVYWVRPGPNPQYNTHILRFSYTSLITPDSVYDYDMQTRDRELLKRQEVLGGYDPAQYASERISATASDGTEVPISLVYRKDFSKDGTHPALLYGYGSYGASIDPFFNSNLLSLLDRGFVYAVAHVRGGGELGEYWKEDGKLLQKRNTFTDFIACAEHLIEQDYAHPKRLAIMGGSAGGLLMGAVVNLRPELFQAVIAKVPFVDVINTIRDPKLLYSVLEYEEWGNPDDPGFYEYIRTYAPYDNVEAKEYPNMLVTASFHDPRVNFWEPAKWVARLRRIKRGDELLLLKTKMVAGHGGASGRYDRLRDTAFEFAFLFKVLEVQA
ncbi:MAG: S9 family peptidase [Actinobacteria bacterium]|nr:S9 family peptidase [Actinomycetota bacterium]